MKINPKTDFSITVGLLTAVSLGLILLKINGILIPKWLVIAFYAVAATNMVVLLTKSKGSKSCKSSCENADKEGTPSS